MIGPHEGKELELMLSGDKPLAMFHDVIFEDQKIPEDIIPEKAFAPYVKSGRFLRREVVFQTNPEVIYVFFAIPSEEWRIEAYIQKLKERYSKLKEHHIFDDVFLGKLLGYSDQDIQHFIDKTHPV